jgi:hypothetical protein
VDDTKQHELDYQRFRAALVALDDDSLGEGLASMSEKSRQELAGQLNLPRSAMHLGDGLVSLVRRRLRTSPPERQLDAAFAMTEGINRETIDALGDRSDDPSRDDLLEVLPPVLEAHASSLVTLMIASYAVSDAQCRDVMRDLLETDDRFAVPEIDEVAPDDPIGTFGAIAQARRRDDDPELEAKREKRREAKAARKAAADQHREARAAGEAKRREAQHEAKKRRSR